MFRDQTLREIREQAQREMVTINMPDKVSRKDSKRSPRKSPAPTKSTPAATRKDSKSSPVKGLVQSQRTRRIESTTPKVTSPILRERPKGRGASMADRYGSPKRSVTRSNRPPKKI